MMPINSTDHIFISYSRKDEEFTRLIVASLRQQGINKIWVDSENLVPGTPIWEEEIEQAIRGSKALIVLCSPDAKRSEWVRREIAYAEQYGKSIIPVLIRGDKTESITISLITRQFLDLRSNTQKGLRQLSDLLAGLEKSNPAPKIDNVEFDDSQPFSKKSLVS